MAVTAIITAGTTATVIITVGITAIITAGGTSADVAGVQRMQQCGQWNDRRRSA